MPEFLRCSACQGSGIIESGGFTKKNCVACTGTGKIPIVDDETDVLLAKQSDHYKEAKENIKKLDPKMTDTDAEKILDDELAKPKVNAATTHPKAKRK